MARAAVMMRAGTAPDAAGVFPACSYGDSAFPNDMVRVSLLPILLTSKHERM